MAAKITEFAKIIRILRIDYDLLAKDMAKDLDVTPSYLSAIELGKKHISDKFIESVVAYFQLNEEKASELRIAALSSQPFIKIDLSQASNQDRALCIKFAEKFPLLTDEQISRIKQILCQK